MVLLLQPIESNLRFRISELLKPKYIAMMQIARSLRVNCELAESKASLIFTVSSMVKYWIFFLICFVFGINSRILTHCPHILGFLLDEFSWKNDRID